METSHRANDLYLTSKPPLPTEQEWASIVEWGRSEERRVGKEC